MPYLSASAILDSLLTSLAARNAGVEETLKNYNYGHTHDVVRQKRWRSRRFFLPFIVHLCNGAGPEFRQGSWAASILNEIGLQPL